jgi:hypothetical protein
VVDLGGTKIRMYLRELLDKIFFFINSFNFDLGRLFEKFLEMLQAQVPPNPKPQDLDVIKKRPCPEMKFIPAIILYNKKTSRCKPKQELI